MSCIFKLAFHYRRNADDSHVRPQRRQKGQRRAQRNCHHRTADPDRLCGPPAQPGSGRRGDRGTAEPDEVQGLPVLSVEDGVVKVIGKARGSKQSSNMLTEFIMKKGGVDFDMPVMLAYSGTNDSLLREYIENSRDLWEGHLDSLPRTMIGSTISTHAGPGAIAAAFFAKE